MFNHAQRLLIRRRIVQAAYLSLRNEPYIHYTQGSRRWDGIRLHKRAYKGQFPNYADCSSWVTWLIWTSVLKYIRNGKVKTDFVNGAAWKYGFTGSQLQHGKRVTGRRYRGDLVFYGSPVSHVAVYVGYGRVISHGSENGPRLLPVGYRVPNQTRRYVL